MGKRKHKGTLEKVVDISFKELTLLISDLLKNNKLKIIKVYLESYGRKNNFIKYNFYVEEKGLSKEYFLVLYPTPNNKSCMYTDWEEITNLINDEILKKYKKTKEIENGKENKKS